MSDILGTDIKLTEDYDIEIVNGDIALVSGIDCLKQDLLHALTTATGRWGLNIKTGSGLIRFVNGGSDPFFIAELRREIKGVFDNESRVKKDSLIQKIYRRSDKIEIEMEFTPIDRSTPESMQYIINTIPGN